MGSACDRSSACAAPPALTPLRVSKKSFAFGLLQSPVISGRHVCIAPPGTGFCHELRSALDVAGKVLVHKCIVDMPDALKLCPLHPCCAWVQSSNSSNNSRWMALPLTRPRDPSPSLEPPMASTNRVSCSHLRCFPASREVSICLRVKAGRYHFISFRRCSSPYRSCSKQ